MMLDTQCEGKLQDHNYKCILTKNVMFNKRCWHYIYYDSKWCHLFFFKYIIPHTSRSLSSLIVLKCCYDIPYINTYPRVFFLTLHLLNVQWLHTPLWYTFLCSFNSYSFCPMNISNQLLSLFIHQAPFSNYMSEADSI